MVATIVHVSPVVYAQAGMVLLRVDTSGPAVSHVAISRRLVGETATDPVVVPAAYYSEDADVELVGNAGVFADTTCPLDVAFEYVASVSGSTTSSVWGPVTVASSGVWRLGAPMRPYLDVLLPLSAPSPYCSASDSIVFVGLDGDGIATQSKAENMPGSRSPVVAVDVMEYPRFGLRVATRTEADLRRMEALFEPGSVLLLRAPSGYSFGQRYFIVESAKIDRVSSDHRKAWRMVSADVRQVDKPAGGSFGWLGARWADLCTGGYATYAALTAAGLSWASIGYGVAGGGYPSVMRTWSEVSATWATWAALTATGRTWADVVGGA